MLTTSCVNTKQRLQVLQRILSSSTQHETFKLKLTSETIERVQNDPPFVDLKPAPCGLEEAYSILLTPQAICFVAELAATFDQRIEQLFWQRQSRKCSLGRPDAVLPTLPDVEAHRHGDWRIPPLPARLKNRQLDLGDVSPANLSHFVHSLEADVQGIQVDFDDGHCPTWRNQIAGLYNVFRAVHNRLPGIPNLELVPVLMLRPRAWNMTEHNMMVNGKEIAGPLFDMGLLLFHNAHQLVKKGCGPFFYLSKLEGADEAKLWNDIFVWCQHKLQIPQGTIKACVLIENILSVFELEEILYALRDHSLGLNCGIWDYSASIIAKFGHRPDFMLPDRNKYVNMNRHFLKSYLHLVVRTCHRRGAPATGGMAALLLPHDGNSDVARGVIDKVCAAKLQEIQEGVDGFMVYDIGLVPHINKLWTDSRQQLPESLDDAHIVAGDLLQMPSGGVTMDGLGHNTAVAVLFIFHWLQGRGHFPHRGAVEDSATAEISRSQIWQWIRHQAPVEDSNIIVTKKLVLGLAQEFVTKYGQSDINKEVLQTAADVFMQIVTTRDFPEFITTYLNDSNVFWNFHK